MNKAKFIQGYIKLQDQLATNKNDPAKAKMDAAKGLGDLLEELILSVKVSSGIPVSTTGTAVAQTGTTTALGTLL